jgi:hypothetical protein
VTLGLGGRKGESPARVFRVAGLPCGVWGVWGV